MCIYSLYVYALMCERMGLPQHACRNQSTLSGVILALYHVWRQSLSSGLSLWDILHSTWSLSSFHLLSEGVLSLQTCHPVRISHGWMNSRVANSGLKNKGLNQLSHPPGSNTIFHSYRKVSLVLSLVTCIRIIWWYVFKM